MKHNEFFKMNLELQEKIAALYDTEVRKFQSRYNKKHPDQHIWRHMLYCRSLFLFKNGCYSSVRIEIVRFRFAGTYTTFTFYGSLFAALSRFSAEFIRKALSEKNQACGMASSVVHPSTLRHWTKTASFSITSISIEPDLTT